MRRPYVMGILALALVELWLPGATPAPKHQDTLQSLYIASFFVSDALGEDFDQILDVAPQGDDVRVRVIRISPVNAFCPGVLVRATERILPHTTVSKLAGKDLCSLNGQNINDAINAARPNCVVDPSDSASQTIVAKCGTATKVLEFPYPVEVNWKALKRSSPDADALWNIDYRIERRAFGKHSPFYEPSSDQEKQLEHAGTAVVPELLSGKYDEAYRGGLCGYHKCDGYLARELTDYSPPPNEDPFVVELLESSSFHFAKYVAPLVTQIAKTARIEGDVKLKVTADPQTGSVTAVEVISGHPLLLHEAVKAVQSWQLVPETVSREPFEVILRFELHCPAK